LFASEDAPREVFRPAIFQYLTFGFISAPHTAFQDVCQLEPAHYMVVEDRRVRLQRYWNPVRQYIQPCHRTFGDARDEYLALLRQTVKDRLIADVPVGLLLSGGIDSGSIAAIMAEQNVSVPTFTIRFRHHDKDEGDVARLMAQHVGAQHEELYVEPDDLIGLLPRLVWHYEQPFGDPSAIPSYYVTRMARQRVTVALNGDGGDENFGGYWRHLMNMLIYRVRGVPTPVWKLLAAVGNVNGQGRTRRWLGWAAEAGQRDPFGAALYWLARSAI
jgi:asparagine synthase (glutamine-hydrolysing)